MLKAAITTLLLASTSVAMADTPYYDRQPAPYGDRWEQRDDRQARRYDDRFDRDRRGRWNNRPVVLAPPQAMSLTNDGFASATIPPQTGRFSRIELNGHSGRQYIDRIVIRFANGNTETVMINRRLNEREPIAVIDFGPRAREIAAVSVYGRSRTRTALSLVGYR